MQFRGIFYFCMLALFISASVNALADEDSKGATVYGAFFESDFGWIQAKFTKHSDNEMKLEFELEGFEPDDFFLLSLVQDDTEMEIAILVPDRSSPPKAGASLNQNSWPMDFPKNFDGHTVFRVRDVTDAIIFEESLRAE